MNRKVGNFLICFVSILCLIQCNSSTTDDSLNNIEFEVTLGEHKVLYQNGELGLNYFPDEAVLLIRREPTYRILVTSAISTYLLEGEDLENLTSAREVLTQGEAGSFDNGYVGASGIYKHTYEKIYVFYHGEDQEGMGVLDESTEIPGFYCSVGVAVSSDEGENWEKVGQLITSSKPKDWSSYEGQSDKGAGEPGAVLTKDGKYLYIYYTEHSRQDNRGVQICMARIPVDNFSLDNCKKYYNGEFSEPSISGKDTPVVSAKHMDDAEASFPHVVYSISLDKYIMICNINFWKEYINDTGLKNSGIYVLYSDDGIKWSEPVKLITDNSVPLIGKSLSWQGTIIWDEGSDTEGWLVYGYTSKWGHLYNDSGIPHHMAGRRIKFD